MECPREIEEKDDAKLGTFRPKAGLENLGRVALNYRDENQKNKGAWLFLPGPFVLLSIEPVLTL